MTRANSAFAAPGTGTAARRAIICFNVCVVLIRRLRERGSCAAGREPRRLASGDAPEHDAGNEASAATVVVIVEPADDLAGRIQAADRGPGGVLHLGARRHAQAAEREGDAGGDAVGVIGRRIEPVGPIAFVDGKAAGAKPVVNIGIEGDVWTRSGIELANGPKEALGID